jgi:ABC-type amino acid transport substrate-binding protein
MTWGRLFLICIAALATSAQFANAADDKLKQIQDRGTLRACFADSVPNNYKDPKTGEWVGFNVDMGVKLAEQLQVKPVWVDATWATIIPSLLTDKCDIALVGLSRTPKRAATILFANPFNSLTFSAVVSKNSKINTYKALDNPSITIAVVSGSAEESYLSTAYKANVRKLVTDKTSAIFLEVAGKRADVAITDTMNVRNFLAANASLDLREIEDNPIVPRGVSWAVAPGEYQLQQFLDVFLESAESSGLKAQLWSKWHKQDASK